MKCKLLFFLSVLLFCYDAYGQQTKPFTGETYAIVVGISKYHYIKPLSYADRDAELFSEMLRSGAGGSVKPENILILKNDSANAGNFWSGMSRLCNKKLKKDDRVYIYFAGHGDAIKGLNEYYLLLSDCQPANDGNNYMLSLGAIDMYHLKNRIGLLTAQGVEVILVLDACRTNELPGGYASQAFSTSIIQANVGDITMLATGPGQISVEHTSFGSGHGIFTYNLVDGLSGRADKETEGNNDQIISLSELKKWVTLHVSQSSEKFNVKQNPVFCCDEKNNIAIGKVDSNFSISWNKFKELSKNNTALPNTKSNRSGGAGNDSTVLILYNKFNEARKQNLLWGENSADEYYEQLHTRFPGNEITEDARYILAADFINFAQQKINLYLEGKDLLSVEIMAEKADSSQAARFLDDEYNRIKKTVSEKWTIAGLMVEKAGRLLSTNKDSSILMQLKPKINFLLSRGFLNGEKESKLNFNEAFQLALTSYKADSTAAYIAECVALLYTYKGTYGTNAQWGNPNDVYGVFGEANAALHYFKKAISIAPSWVSPYRSIGVKVYGIASIDTAAEYMRKALQVNPNDVSTYLLFGDLYRYRFPDSSTVYYKHALNLAPKSAQADIYYKIGRNFLRLFRNMKSYAVKTDSALWYSSKALAADPHHPEIYWSIGDIYERLKKTDTAMTFYRNAIGMNPAYTHMYVCMVDIFKERNQQDSILFYCHKLLKSSPENWYAFHTIAEYYDGKKGFADSAIAYYKLALPFSSVKIDADERLAYLLMEKNKTDTLPLYYFIRLQNHTPYGWRNFYNIACYYSNSQQTDKSIEFLEKAFLKGMRNVKQVETDRFLAFIRESEAYKKLMAKYFP